MANNTETTPRDRSEDSSRSKQQNPSQAGNTDSTKEERGGSSTRSGSQQSRSPKRSGQSDTE